MDCSFFFNFSRPSLHILETKHLCKHLPMYVLPFHFMISFFGDKFLFKVVNFINVFFAYAFFVSCLKKFYTVKPYSHSSRLSSDSVYTSAFNYKYSVFGSLSYMV